MEKQQRLESQRGLIVQLLGEAGPKGLAKKDLKLGTSGEKALKELRSASKIFSLGRAKTHRYYLTGTDRTEIAYERIFVKTSDMNLYTKTELSGACPAEIKEYADKALDRLIKDCKLVKFPRKVKNKKSFYFIHMAAIQAAIPSSFHPAVQPVQAEPPVTRLDRSEVIAAYQKVKKRLGFSNVEIYELRQELGADMETLKQFLKEERQRGMTILTLGDWSLSSEAVRSGAVYIDNKPYLLVRFKE